MPSTRKLPAKKRPVGGYSDDYSLSSSGSSSASSTSFQMEENSSDEEMETGDYKDKEEASQIKLMDISQESNLSAPSPLGLATQPVEGPAKKRKVSLSPPDSLAKGTRPQSPSSIIMVNKADYKQEHPVPLLHLEDPHVAEPEARLQETSTSQLSPETIGATRVHATNNEASTSKRAQKPSKQKKTKEDEAVSSVVMAKEKTAVTTKQAETRLPRVTSKPLEAKSSPTNSASRLKKSPEKTPPKSTPPPSKATPKSNASDVKGSVVTSIETAKEKASTKQNLSRTAKEEADIKSFSGKEEIKPKVDCNKKRKKKKTFQDQFLQHVFFSGKPHTLKDLTQHLKTSEASINYCLLSLVDKGWIIKKEFTSKSRSKELYWANNNSKNKELLAALDVVPPEEVAEARVKLANLQQKEKSIMIELNNVIQEPSNDELNERVADAEKDVAGLKAQVDAALKRIAANKQPVVHKQKVGFVKSKVSKARSNPKDIKVEINRMRDEWKKRKEKCTDFIECLADGMEKKVKDVIKMLELETDEKVGVKMPSKYDIKK